MKTKAVMMGFTAAIVLLLWYVALRFPESFDPIDAPTPDVPVLDLPELSTHQHADGIYVDWSNINSKVAMGAPSHFVHIQFKDTSYVLDWDVLREAKGGE